MTKHNSNDKNHSKNSAANVTAAMVKDYLKIHPDFIQKNSELLSLLTQPFTENQAFAEKNNNVVDLQSMILRKLQKQMITLRSDQGSIIDASRNNLSTQARIHEAVLTLLEAENLEHLFHIVKQDWADNLQIDCVSICFDRSENFSYLKSENIRILTENTVSDYFGEACFNILRGDVKVSLDIFGSASSLVHSEALIRIAATEFSPEAILAFGSRDPDYFHAGQGTELLCFMANSFKATMLQHIRNKRL